MAGVPYTLYRAEFLFDGTGASATFDVYRPEWPASLPLELIYRGDRVSAPAPVSRRLREALAPRAREALALIERLAAETAPLVAPDALEKLAFDCLGRPHESGCIIAELRQPSGRYGWRRYDTSDHTPHRHAIVPVGAELAEGPLRALFAAALPSFAALLPASGTPL